MSTYGAFFFNYRYVIRILHHTAQHVNPGIEVPARGFWQWFPGIEMVHFTFICPIGDKQFIDALHNAKLLSKYIYDYYNILYIHSGSLLVNSYYQRFK